MWRTIGERFRVLRRRLKLRQVDLAATSGVSRRTIQNVERGAWQTVPVSALERLASALGGRLQVNLSWNGEQLDRLVDAGHAELQNAFAVMLRAAGWTVAVEVSFNHYGERGRYDLLAFHPATGIVLVIEIKTAVGDVQATLGTLDVKVRLARDVAKAQGWSPPSAVIPVLLIADERQQHRVVADHGALFARFDRRGRSARAWLKHPLRGPTGLLLFLPMTNAHAVSVRKASRGRRVRKPAANVTNAPLKSHSSSFPPGPPP
jgi:transcriptional regulator with XRE-family HTH domain